MIAGLNEIGANRRLELGTWCWKIESLTCSMILEKSSTHGELNREKERKRRRIKMKEDERFVCMGEFATISIGDCQISGAGDRRTCDERVSMPWGRCAIPCRSNPRPSLSPRVCKHSQPVYHRRGIDGDSSNYKYLESTRSARSSRRLRVMRFINSSPNDLVLVLPRNENLIS